MTRESKPYELKLAKLYTGLLVEYEVRQEGGPYLRVIDPKSGQEIVMCNTSDLWALRDIVCRIAPRSWQFRLWLWRKVTFRETRARWRMRRYIGKAKTVCEELK